jgi:hypothetical protein
MSINKQKLNITSIFLALLFSLFPTIPSGEGNHSFGIPAETLTVFEGWWGFHINPLAFVVNFLVFYWLTKFIMKKLTNHSLKEK